MQHYHVLFQCPLWKRFLCFTSQMHFSCSVLLRPGLIEIKTAHYSFDAEASVAGFYWLVVVLDGRLCHCQYCNIQFERRGQVYFTWSGFNCSEYWYNRFEWFEITLILNYVFGFYSFRFNQDWTRVSNNWCINVNSKLIFHHSRFKSFGHARVCRAGQVARCIANHCGLTIVSWNLESTNI